MVGLVPTIHVFASLTRGRVQGMDAGNVLKLYKEPGKEVLVNIPHNATWIARRNAQLSVDNKVWEKVSPEGHAEEVLGFLNGSAPPKIGMPAKTRPVKKVIAKKAVSIKATVKKSAVKNVQPKKPGSKKAAGKK